MKVYVTVYALTTGIEELDVEGTQTSTRVQHGDPASISCRYFFGEGKDWHRDRPSAVARAEQMRLAKIASLRKKIAKLEVMSFEEKP